MQVHGIWIKYVSEVRRSGSYGKSWGTTMFKVLEENEEIRKEKRMSGRRGGRRTCHMFSWKAKK